MKKTKEKIIEDWKRDLIFDLGNLVSPEAIIIIFGKIDELLSLQTQEMVEEIEKLDGEFERDDESNFIKGWRAALEKIKIKILIKQ